MSQETWRSCATWLRAFNRGDLDAWSTEGLADDIDHRAAEGALDDHGPDSR